MRILVVNLKQKLNNFDHNFPNEVKEQFVGKRIIAFFQSLVLQAIKKAHNATLNIWTKYKRILELL